MFKKLSDKLLLLVLKHRLKDYIRSEKWYLKDKSIGDTNWYTRQGIPQLKKDIAELENKIRRG